MDLPQHSNPDQVLPLLLQLARCVRQRVSEQYASIGINDTRAGILEVLGKKSASVSQKELSQELCLSESNICGLVERMRKEGLIVRCRSMIDRRRSVLRLTSEGSQRLSEVLALHTTCEQEFIKDLSVKESFETVRVIKQLLEGLSQSTSQTRRVA